LNIYGTMVLEVDLIISFASSKGGVGKSTSCAAIASALAIDGDRVLVLDLDENRTLTRWGAKTTLPDLFVETVNRDDFTERFRKAVQVQDFDYILIDLMGAREATMLKALARSDLVIIPAQASEPDLREALVIRDDIRDVIEAGAPGLVYRVLLTKLYPLATKVTAFAHAEIKRHKLDRFRAGLIERAAYREMFLNGVPPSLKEVNRGAGPEIRSIVTEIRALDPARSENQGSAA
jgi:chromosome partitioning protein